MENEFKANSTWSYEKKCEIALKLNLTFNQVSKWNWDQKKKEGIECTRNKKKPTKSPKK